MSENIPVIHAIPVLKDNYTWLLETSPGYAVLLDPGDSSASIAALQRHHLTLTHILITHHHQDHIGGVSDLARLTGAKVVGHALDAGRLPPLDLACHDGDSLTLGPWTCEVLATPGHTIGHVVYRIADALFTGDTLFSLGCGRLFEGTPEMMWDSIKRLRGLSGIQRIFPAHEYTLANLGFVLQLEPGNPFLSSFREWVHQQTDLGVPTLPTTMERELRCNPFLRADETDFAARIGLGGKTGVAVFTHIRTMRNHY
ncbi:MAG: hydroxyacylglutathione hydrolase [Nitrospirae bacterium]|nr:hydroxyacylglutathione hydrolase [Magnetococcales bacterium]HAT49319.1 hydroxyacylglutathione hydrolase [Alphaproteobacteria bacterium]